jgi:3-phenylpropionate/cinnamic acid dioxygenase small subunit
MSFEGVELLLKTHEVTVYLYKLAHLLDDFDVAAFVEEFTEDGSYRLMTRQNFERGLRIHVIDDDKDRLKYRRDLILKYWQYEKFHSTRVLSSPLVSFPDRDRAESRCNFVVYQTSAEGIAQLNLVGLFQDRLVFENGRWRIKDRFAILENSLPEEAVIVPP